MLIILCHFSKIYKTGMTHDPMPNCKNGKTAKIIKHPSGNFELEILRDRNSTLEPLLIQINRQRPGKYAFRYLD